MTRTTRRDFLKGAAIGGAGLLILKDSSLAFGYSANEKLNVAAVGAGGKGHSNIGPCSHAGENIVALCDADYGRAADAFKDWPNAKRYHDFRRMYDEMGDQIDAVLVSTPDHFHAIAAVTAMRMGKHVYCEKPLTRSIYEARLMRETAKKYKVATQMGNQGSADPSLREGVEVLQAGAIGKIREVHVWSNRPIWPQGMNRPTETPPIPADLDWDVWLGPRPMRPYNPAYLPFAWRGWKDFGTGALGDMACHTMNLVFRALDLANPISVEAEVHEMTSEAYPKQSIIKYTYPHANVLQPYKLTWYDGGLKPSSDVIFGQDMPGSGCVVIGDKGRLYTGGDNGGNYVLLPRESFEGYRKPAPTIPRSIGHHEEFLAACKGGPPAYSNFDFASQLVEFILLGNLAMTTGEKIYWDPKQMKAIGCPEADPWIKPAFRKGWTL